MQPIDDSFLDQASFQLRHGRDNREHRFAHGSRRVKRFLVRHEIDAENLELFESKNELYHAFCKPVETPYDHRIEQAAPGISHQRIEPGPLGFAPLARSEYTR
jgi:hypothetical protein